MKLWLFKFSLIFTFLCAGNFCDSLPVFASDSSLRFSIAVPQESFDFSDLDLRDANNKPIKNRVTVQKIQQLFTHNLTQMLLENLTPLRKVYLRVLSGSWDLTSGWLRSVHVFVVTICYAIFQKFQPLFKASRANGAATVFVKTCLEYSAQNISSLSLLLIRSVQLLR